jgi:hypothetical protein
LFRRRIANGDGAARASNRAVSGRLIHAFAAAAFVSFLIAACGGTSITQLTGPDTTRCQSSLTDVPRIPAQGGQIQAGVLAAPECTWSVSSEAAWIQVNPPASGQGEATLTLIAAENPEAATRSGVLSLNGERISLTQEPAPCQYAVGTSRITIGDAGGIAVVPVTATGGCSWTIESAESWIVPRSGGTGSGSALLQVAKNTDNARRGIVRVAGQSITIEQEGGPSNDRDETPAPPPDASPAPAPAPAPAPTPLPLPVPAPKPPDCDGKKKDDCKSGQRSTEGELTV